MKRRISFMDKETEKIIKAVVDGKKTELAASVQLDRTIKTVHTAEAT